MGYATFISLTSVFEFISMCSLRWHELFMRTIQICFFLIALFPDYQFCHRLANRQKMKNQKTRKKKFMNIWKERKKLRKTINVFLNLTRVKPATTQLKRYWQPLKSYDDMCLNPDILPNGRHMGTLVSAEGRFQLPLGAEMFLSKTLFMQIYEWDTFCF